MDVRQRFLQGLATDAGFDAALLDQPNTVLRDRSERTDTGIVVLYHADELALLWGDPKLISQLDDLADPDRTLDLATATTRIEALGSARKASADMRVLADPARVEPGPIPDGYAQRWLSSDDEAHVQLVRDFADRSDPDDVEEAALDEMDDFNEQVINVLVPLDRRDFLVAYSSAVTWDWDAGFADIGVMVDADHRGQGLGTLVVAHTVAALVADGQLPLYRHGHSNQKSQRIAEAIGFTRATTLHFFAPPD